MPKTAPRRRLGSWLKSQAGITLGCILTGGMFWLSVPPWGFWPLAFLGVAGLDRLLAGQRTLARFGRGWLVTGTWLLGATFWMLDFSPVGYLAANVSYSFFYGAACALTPPKKLRRVVLPAWLVLVGYLRWRWPFGGVPLATLPHSQADAPLAATGRVLGPLLIVALAGIVGTTLSALAERAWLSGLRGASLVGAALVLATISPTGASGGENPEKLQAAVVQGGGPQRTRASETDFRAVLARHIQATDSINRRVDIILWPENVVNVDGSLLNSSELAELAEIARRHSAWFIPGVVEDAGPNEFFNFSLAISPDGNVVDRYDKVRRVPFGEYVPLRPLIERFSGGELPSSEARAGVDPAVLRTDLGQMGVLISWEVFFEDRALDAVRNGGELLLNPTNGSSYWLTIVQSQQVASSRLRAIETGRWVLQASPTGFSAVVDPSGKVLERTGVSEQAVIFAEVELRSGMTWAARAGPLPMLLLAAAAVVTAWALILRERRKPR